MKQIKTLLLTALMLAFGLSLWAQNTSPGYRYASGQYFVDEVNDGPCIPGDPTSNTATISFLFKFEVDASATVTTSGGGVLLSSLTTFPTVLSNAVSVNFGAGSGPDDLHASVDEIIGDVAYITVQTTRIYRICDIPSGLVNVSYLDGPRTGLAGVGLSGDTDPLTNFDNRDANLSFNLIIPFANILSLEKYSSPVSDVGNFTRRATGKLVNTIDLDATVDESVNLDTYGMQSAFNSGLFAGNALEEAGVPAFSLNTGSGQISFSSVNATPGRYPLQIVAFDDRGGATPNDFIVELVDCINGPTAPSFVDVGNVTATGGTSDPDIVYFVPDGNTLTLNVEVAPGDVNSVGVLVETSALPAGSSFIEDPLNPDNYIFTWTVDQDDPIVNLTVFATDVDANGDKICESAEIRYNIVPTPPCPQRTATLEITYDPSDPSVDCFDPDNSSGIDVAASINGNSLFSYSWELIDDDAALASVALTATGASLSGFMPLAGFETIRVTITDENVLGCVYTEDISISRCAGACDPSDDILAIIDASNAGAGCGEEELTYYDGVSGPITLEAQVTAGLTGPFTYLWSTTETTATIDVSPTMNTTYSVEITDANGCIANADVDVIYCDARAYKKNGKLDNKKVTICHYPPGNPGNVQTITISVNALCTHITQHNDQIGDCDCGSSNKTSNPVDFTEITALNVFPNPSAGHFNIEYNLPEAGDVNIVMTDLTGRVVYTEAFDGAAGLYEHSLDLQGNAPGIYLLKVTLNADEYTVKVNITE